VSRLWLYHLHYFDFLNAADWVGSTDTHIAIVGRWIVENPPGSGTGWEPYPTSLRIVNWIKRELRSPWMLAETKTSLFHQARWLGRNLEYHLLGNHLWSNAKALLFAGAFFEGAQADRWFRTALQVLRDQLREQVLDCGGHFERSPMYHALFLEDLLDLSNILRAYGLKTDPTFEPSVVSACSQMEHWLVGMSHPDGDISFFNDAAFGVAPKLAELQAYATRLDLEWPTSPGGRLEWFDQSGYAVATAGSVKMIMDLAPVGPDYLPAHGHADTLSFEMSLGAQRVFVNSGTSTYDTSPERLRQRGTAAHNTAVIDGKDSSQVWSRFRVAKRAVVEEREFNEDPDLVRIQASHNGYRRLREPVTHTRIWELDDRGVRITDRFTGSGHHKIGLFFHLHPNILADGVGQGRFDMRTEVPGFERVTVEVAGADASRLMPGTWHPQFGVSEPTSVLHAVASGALPLELVTIVKW
jgi:uncharacterized heparinase superfamily protein